MPCINEQQNSDDGVLVSYYEALKFKKELELGVNKPEYDYSCIFMSQETKELENRRQFFFETFNPSENDILV